MALVIGISDYSNIAPLSQTVIDARKIEAVLKDKAGFSVTRVVDPSAAALRQQVDDFADRIRPGDVVVVYYAGHGVQVRGRNYLLPHDFPRDGARLAEMALAADDLLATINARGPAAQILILDACRNNPLAPGGTAGLARMEPSGFGAGTRIEFAAAAGQVAQDGLFATHLAVELARAGADVDEVFRNVRAQVIAESKGLQTTFSASQMVINFYFVPGEVPDAERALSILERASTSLPRGDVGQTAAVEGLIKAGRSLSGSRLLQGLSLRNGRFLNGDFSRAYMVGVDLSHAVLTRANLSAATVTFADLSSAQFGDAVLEGASFAFSTGECEADQSGGECVRFTKARAAASGWFGFRGRGAQFQGADLSGARFVFADLRGANFDGADLTGAFLLGSDLTGATFVGATVDNTDFAAARFEPASLKTARLVSACATPLALEQGAFAGAFNLTVIERIPSTRFEGGFENRPFVNQPFLYVPREVGLPPCKPRQLAEGLWYPVWKPAPDSEQMRSDLGIGLEHAFLQQTGRRADVRSRIEQVFGRLYPVPVGNFRVTADSGGAPLASADRWTLTIGEDRTMELRRSADTVMRAVWTADDRYRLVIADRSEPPLCQAAPRAEYRWVWSGESFRLTSHTDRCPARMELLNGRVFDRGR